VESLSISAPATSAEGSELALTCWLTWSRDLDALGHD